MASQSPQAPEYPDEQELVDGRVTEAEYRKRLRAWFDGSPGTGSEGEWEAICDFAGISPE